MTKDILTKDNIENDIRDFIEFKNSLITDQFLNFFIPLTLLAVLIFVAAVLLSYPLVAAVVFIPSALFLLWYIFKIRKSHLKWNTVIDVGYSVVKDELINIVEDTIVETHHVGSKARMLRTVKFMYFSSGKWRIPSSAYSWSDTFKMSNKGLDNTSLIGDVFYVVSLNCTGDICCAYNTKFFEYKG